MKSILSLIVCAFSVLALASTAQSKDSQANGNFDFSTQGATGSIVFEANGNEAGVTGQMTFNATVVVGTEDGETTTTTDVAIGAQFDCMLVDNNQAALSGAITSSSIPAVYPVGKPVTLFVVDKVEGIHPIVDGFAWGVYKPNFKNLTASDYDFCPTPSEFTPDCGEESCPPPASCSYDGVSQCEGESCTNTPGASLTWTATDYDLCPAPSDENPNPPCASDPNGFTEGIPAIPTAVSCESFPLSSYPVSFVDGNKIQVKNHP
jgi:hypothetical protein